MPGRTLPTGPTFEGRVLPRPDEEVVDQGLQFDVATLLSRRRMLRTLGLGAVGIGLAACSTATGGTGSTAGRSTGPSTAAPTSGRTGLGSLAEIPDETAGPYPGDGSNGPDVLEQSGIVRADIRSSFDGASGTADGVPMTLTLNLVDLAAGGTPFAGVAVYAWHCTRDGRYSMYSEGITEENYLRGVQIADAGGQVSFTSVVPGCYSGRWPHVHFEVYPDEAGIGDAANAIATSQVALPKDICDTVYAVAGYEASGPNLAQVSLDSDNVFGDDDGESQLATVTGDVAAGYTVVLAVGIDTATTATTPAGGGAPAGGGGGPAGGGGPGRVPPDGGPGGPGGAPGSGGPGAPSGDPGTVSPTAGATT